MTPAAAAAFETARLVSGHTPAALQLVGAYVALVQPSKVGPLMEHLRQALPLASLQHLKRVRKAPQQPHTEVLLCALRDLEGQQQQQQQQQQCVDVQQQQHQQAATPAAETLQHQSDLQEQQQQQQQQYPAGLPSSTSSVLASLQAQVTLQQVPGSPPDNRQQWQDWSKLWPMPWRCPAGAAEQQDGQPPSASDQQYFAQHMAALLAAAAAGGGGNAARIVDPTTGAVLGQAVDGSRGHPLDHAVMCAVEAVAARDRRLWPFNGFAHSGRHAEAPDAGGYLATPTQHPVVSSPRAGAGVGGPDGVAVQQQCDQQQQQCGWQDDHQQEQQQQLDQQQQLQQQQAAAALPPCKKHKADAGPTAAGTMQPASLDAPTVSQAASGDPSNGVNGTADTTTAAAAATAVSDASGGTDWSRKPYLCTGYDCFVLQEPCIMCSMALVHSRVARVVYCRGDGQHGALGGRLRLQAQRSLNHHYLVYHMPTQGQQQQQQQV